MHSRSARVTRVRGDIVLVESFKLAGQTYLTNSLRYASGHLPRAGDSALRCGTVQRAELRNTNVFQKRRLVSDNFLVERLPPRTILGCGSHRQTLVESGDVLEDGHQAFETRYVQF